MKNCIMAVQIVSAQADLAAEFFNGGRIELYEGSQPHDVDDDFLPRTPLVVFKLNDPAFSKAKNGRIDMYPVAPATILKTGNVGWGRAFAADGRRLMDFTVGEREHLFNMVVDRTAVREGEELVMVSFSHTVATSANGL